MKNIKLFTNRGAMFGLDARIALAIFGALSVITGVALYSAIQQAKAMALLSDLREIGKAWESFYIDTGVHLEPVNTDPNHINYYIAKTAGLVLNTANVQNWKGPYLPFNVVGTTLEYKTGQNAHIMTLTSEEWPNAALNNDFTDGLCTTTKQCYIWSRIYPGAVLNEDLAKSVDKIVDNGDGKNAGNFRWNNGYNLKITPRNNPHD